MNALFLQFLKEMQNKGCLKYYENYPLSRVSTFGIGGKARIFVTPYSEETLIDTVRFAGRYGRYIVIGNASNLLFDDRGFCGTVISTVRIRALRVVDEPETVYEKLVFEKTNPKSIIYAECGAMLPALCVTAQNYGYEGFEGLCSIPATVGGALCSNAGAFGCEISDKLIAYEYYQPKTGMFELRFPEKGEFSYRKSSIASHGEILLSAYFEASEGDRAGILEKTEHNKALRNLSQPTGVRSAGSYFRRPEPGEGRKAYRGKSAGELIELCGFKGAVLGGAQVSQKHANFIINVNGNGRAKDVLTLAGKIKGKVYAKSGVKLKEEVIFIPYSGRIGKR